MLKFTIRSNDVKGPSSAPEDCNNVEINILATNEAEALEKVKNIITRDYYHIIHIEEMENKDGQ